MDEEDSISVWAGFGEGGGAKGKEHRDQGEATEPPSTAHREFSCGRGPSAEVGRGLTQDADRR
jgi:hypothetical protein